MIFFGYWSIWFIACVFLTLVKLLKIRGNVLMAWIFLSFIMAIPTTIIDLVFG